MTRPAPAPPTRRWPRRLARLAVASLGLAAVATGVAGLAGWSWYTSVRDPFLAEAESHRALEVAHPGWSFPGQVWSASAAADLSGERRVAHAKARGYTSACPAVEPGSFCAKTSEVRPRSGDSLEPVLLGWLVGPDAELREHLPLDQAPKHLIAAILAAEDAGYYDHIGIQPLGLVRALLRNASAGGYAQGGSTLTMQVVRNLTQQREKTLRRKVTEIAQAVALDRALGKDAVLQMYLDAPYLGQQGSYSICGFQAASRHYWGKDAVDLSLAQAATLAAILPAPGRFAPDRKPELAKERRDRVLQAMALQGWEVSAALAEPIDTRLTQLPEAKYPSYFAAVRRSLLDALPESVVYGSGLQVHTAMDVVAQQAAEKVLAEKVPFLERTVGRRAEGPLRGAIAVIDPKTGRLIAAADSGQEGAGDLSRVTQTRRQPGSSFKPVVYAMAFEQRDAEGKPKFTPGSAMPNQRRVFEGTNGWMPRNIAGRYSNTAALAHALSSSHNIATASLLERAGGPGALIAFADHLGFDVQGWPAEYGLALGQGEVTVHQMARFTAMIRNGGLRVDGSPLVRVVDANGRVRLESAAPTERAMSEDGAALTRELMNLVVDWGTGGAARGSAGELGAQGALMGKTGTTDAERDLWFIGATYHHAAALWLGYDQPTKIGAAASDLAAPLWGWTMNRVEVGLPVVLRFDPYPFQRTDICTQTGLRPAESCKWLPVSFLQGSAPTGACPGTHEPETGIDVSSHMSLWKRIAHERELAEALARGELPPALGEEAPAEPAAAPPAAEPVSP